MVPGHCRRTRLAPTETALPVISKVADDSRTRSARGIRSGAGRSDARTGAWRRAARARRAVGSGLSRPAASGPAGRGAPRTCAPAGWTVVHRTRVATRRYRSVLREIRGLLDPSAATVLDEGLRWYARLLGDVRDVQVLQDSLDDALTDLPDEPVNPRRPGPCRRLLPRSRLETAGPAPRPRVSTSGATPKLSDLLAEWRGGMPFVADLHPELAGGADVPAPGRACVSSVVSRPLWRLVGRTC